MTLHHIGNNWYWGRESNGDSRDEVPTVEGAIYLDIDNGLISNYTNNAWNNFSFGSRTDQLLMSVTRQLTLNNIGTSYIDIFPAFYDGFPIPIDTTGFTKLGMVVLWNKSSGTGIHDIRLINNANPSEILVHTENVRIANEWSHDGLKNGRTVSYNIPIPTEFKKFRGEIRIQAKSTVGTDNPVFDGLLIYLIR